MIIRFVYRNDGMCNFVKCFGAASVYRLGGGRVVALEENHLRFVLQLSKEKN